MHFTIRSTTGIGSSVIRVKWESIYVAAGERDTDVKLDGTSNVMQQIMLALFRVVDAEAPGWRERVPCCHLWRVDRCDVHPTPDALASLRT